MLKELIIRYFSRAHHCSQVVTGFHMFCEKNGIPYAIEDHSTDVNYPYKETFIEVLGNGLTMVYDMSDGYHNLDAMQWFLNKSDYYFKRSYSQDYNKKYLLGSDKIYPYGFNYFVTYKGNPLDGSRCKDFVKSVLGMNHNTIFIPSAFEEIPCYTEDPKVLFSVRLWPQDTDLSDELNRERLQINSMRVNIVRALKSRYGKNFYGGLYDNTAAREIAPELIIPSKLTSKNVYLDTLHKCDICIGTMGLHESIGGKTGEYVAAAKGIVLERLHYDVTGDFIEGKNYFSFETMEECLDAVERLYLNPDLLYRMKVENAIYYQKFLRPDRLVEQTLKVVGVI